MRRDGAPVEASTLAVMLEETAGPAADYLDIPYMRIVWQTIQREDTPEALRKADTVLTRGIMAGRSVNSLDQDATAHRRPADR